MTTLRRSLWNPALACLAMFVAATAGAQTVHAIDMRRLDDPSQFAFLSPVLRDVDVVSLGESIHLTSDFPLVRIGMIRYLNQSLGYGIVAMEGSAEDIWVAQDRLLGSARSEHDVTGALSGLFTIWNTEDVRKLIAYEAESWKTNHPLYVAAYDVQPGTGQGTHGGDVFRQLVDRLGAYVPAPSGVNADQIVAGLTPLANACARYSGHDSARVERAIADVGAWATTAAPMVETRYPNVPHGAVLRLIPENLRASHRLCAVGTTQGWGRYKSVRDTNAAGYALALRNVSPNRKLVVWAHLSHVSHNSKGTFGVSVGQILHRELGARVYTVMPFAEGGFAPLIYSDVNDDITYGFVHGTSTPAGARLGNLSDNDYFLDLRTAGEDSVFTNTQRLAVEAETTPVVLASDFDGIIWIKRVHPAHFIGFTMPMMLVGASVVHYGRAVITVLAIMIILFVARFIRNRRRRRVLATA